MAIDCVVVNYKTNDLLRDFITSYEREKFKGCTLIIVDVCPVGAWLFPKEHTYISVQDNIGYARACNLGAAKGENDVILLANADTLLYRLAECYDALTANADWGILGPRQVDEYNRITAGGIFGSETNIGQRGWQEIDHGQYDDIRDDAKSVSGSLYFIKRRLWQKLTDCDFMQAAFPGIEGAFIPTQHYYEETACSYHARAHGYKVVYYGPVQMVHYWHKSSPIGGHAEQQVEASKALMRSFLHSHEIVCE